MIRLIKKAIILLLVFTLAAFIITGCTGNSDDDTVSSDKLSGPADIGLYDIDGAGTNYEFTYGGVIFDTMYLYDCWTIYNSYKITDHDDMVIICQALIDTHAVHGSDYVSYRTAEDMAYEWEQHNLAYRYLPEDNSWKSSAANVDLDPEDQGRSFEEIYEDRTGQEIDIKEYLKEKLKDGELIDVIKQVIN